MSEHGGAGAPPADPPDPASLTPDRYLANGFVDATGKIRPEHLGFHAFAAALQFQHANVPVQELAATYEALAQLMPLTEGSPTRRLREAVEEALDLVARMLNIANSEAIEDWIIACAEHIHTQADLDAFLAHFQAVMRHYGALAAVTEGAEGEEQP